MKIFKSFRRSHTRLTAMLLVLVCMLGLFPATAFAAGPETITLDDCTYNGIHYESPALGVCYMHKMQFDVDGDSIMGFCSQKGAGMGLSLIHISEPTRQAEISYAVFCLKKKRLIFWEMR